MIGIRCIRFADSLTHSFAPVQSRDRILQLVVVAHCRLLSPSAIDNSVIYQHECKLTRYHEYPSDYYRRPIAGYKQLITND